MLESKDWFLEVATFVFQNHRQSAACLRQDVHVMTQMLAFHKLIYSLLSVEEEGEEEAD